MSFSEEEKYQLRKFVNKSYLLDKGAHRHVYYSLIDILLAYCYETRVTEGEQNVSAHVSVHVGTDDSVLSKLYKGVRPPVESQTCYVEFFRRCFRQACVCGLVVGTNMKAYCLFIFSSSLWASDYTKAEQGSEPEG